MEKKIVALILIALLTGLGGYGLGFVTIQPQISSLQAEYDSVRTEYDRLVVDYDTLNNTYWELQINSTKLQSSYNSLNETHSVLQIDLTQLQSNYDALDSKYTALNKDYQTLQSDYNVLDGQYQTLQSDYNVLDGNYQVLAIDYSTLQDDYDSLSSEFVSLQFSLETWEQFHIGTTLETYYDYVRANVVTLGGNPLGEEEWWSYPNYYQLSVDFAANEAAHDAGNLWWPALEEGSHYYEYTGEYSYETSSGILQNVLLMSEIGSYDDNATKIDKIMKFVGSIVSYEFRLIDHMWFPAETLAFRSGDCTSFSILEAALFEMVGIKSAIGFFENSEGEGHAMVLVHLEDLGEYGYWYYSDLTSFGLSAGKWIMIEPQYNSLLEQEKNQDSWMPQWELLVTAEVDHGP